MKSLLILCMLLCTQTLYSQSLSLFDIDTSNFPAMKAKFYAFDAQRNQQSPNIGDMTLKENGVMRTIININCPPPAPPKALSSVLVIDVSGSMSWGATGIPNIDLAKAAAIAWVNGLPLGRSECAITSFSDNNYLNQDFTTNRNKLLNAINALRAQGGTDYDVALIKPMAGGLLVSETGKYTKVLVFISDGQPNYEPNTSMIISEAQNQGCVIYAVTLGMPAPQSLKDIAAATGGQVFENVTSVKQAEDVYKKILQVAQGGSPCTIEWQSNVSCQAVNTNVELQWQAQKATGSYQSPQSTIAKLEFNPKSIKFTDPQVGVRTEQKITVTARYADFSITNITSNNGGFDITPKNFTLPNGQSIELTVSYTPADSGFNYCRFEIEITLCQTRLYASGGWKGKKPLIQTLKLMHPNGGEVFVAGSDTVITWEGVGPDEPVKLEYRTSDTQPWITITDTAKGFSHPFKVPRIASKKYLARITANAKKTSVNEMVLIRAGTFQMGNTGAHSGFSEEKPVRSVTISRNFLMSAYEITQKQYEEVMGTNPSSFKGENLPVESVSWFDAVAFCNNLSEMEGLDKCYSGSGDNIVCDWNATGYRLPTEGEWEYAAKAGTITDFYSGDFTNDSCTPPIDANLKSIGWYCGNANNKTQEVGQKAPNDFGLFDMSGNVSEWCWDWYAAYTNTTVTDPKGPAMGSSRVFRGGSWSSNAVSCRSAYRNGNNSFNGNNNIGFRIVRPQKQ
ncbi:MAG TPA: SUMF1/EgtB/PvdO family nonheme iron enzyme [Candidatus Kapabacteria bacterium]|nr:SUMF1/EgtB/PvdO family nonheme iron enzyme [Candidatus Kapabacteria bacterium]